MDVPDLVRRALGDEEVQAGVSLGDDDAICFTPTRSIVYRGEGLLSDEEVSVHPHDFQRLTVSEGRRKTTFTLTYVDREAEFTVPGNRTDDVLERLLEGNLRVSGVLDANEAVTGVFRFSELTLIVTESRLLKHVGEHVWQGDFEAYAFDDVTGLHFEDGSVATAMVIEADGRTERIKAPNDRAALVRQTLETVLFDYYDVDSLDELNGKIAVAEANDASDDDTAGGFGFDSGIDPLVGRPDETDATAGTEQRSEQRTEQRTEQTRDQPGSTGAPAIEEETEGTDEPSPTDDPSTADASAASSEDLSAVTEQLADLTATVERQNKLLRQQQRTIEKLVEELRRGR